MPVSIRKPAGERYWRGFYYIKSPSERVYFTTRRTQKDLAWRVAQKIFKEALEEADGLAPPKAIRDAGKIPLALHLEDFLRAREVAGRCPKYVRGVGKQLERVFRSCGWVYPQDLKRDTFEMWRNRQSINPKTLNEYLGALSSFCGWMFKVERLPCNPFAVVSKVSTAGKETKTRRAFGNDELARLCAVSGRRGVVYLTAAFTGLRRNELQQLQWRDIDLTASRPRIRARASTTKNGKEAHIPLHAEVVQALRSIEPQERNPGDRVFKGLIPRMPRFKEDLKAAGVPYVDDRGQTADFHSLRNTFATMLTLSGKPQREIMELMRHSDMRLTAKVYTDAGKLPLFETVASLPGVADKVKTSAQNTAQDFVPGCPNVSKAVPSGKEQMGLQSPENERIVPECRDVANGDDGARCRVRTCDPCRVKAVLYR